MTEKKADGLINLKAMDPAVAAALGKSSQALAEKRMSKKERKSVTRERNKAAARNGSRALYDLDPEMIQQVREIAEKNSTTASQVAGLALAMFLDGVWSGTISVRDFRKPIDNPRYGYALEYRKKS